MTPPASPAASAATTRAPAAFPPPSVRTLFPILLGLLATVPGAILGVLTAYALLALRMPESQGRRGLAAGIFGSVPGAIAGFIAAHALASWIQDGGGGPCRGVIAGAAAAGLAAFLAGLLALVAGVHLAEARGISNYAGERAAWSLLYIALPTALAAGAVAYLLTRWTIA